MSEDFKLDRNSFHAHKAEDSQKLHAAYWQSKTIEERLKAAMYLNSVAYGFDPANPPRLDKTVFSIRKRS